MSLNQNIVLTPMAPGRDSEFEQMLAEFRDAGEIHVYRTYFAVAWQGYAAFYDLIQQMKTGGHPTPEIVPMDAYFIETDGRILGEIYIRHRLTPHLEKIGGHIGYKVRPTERNKGVATAALKLALRKVFEIGLGRALITCNDTNIASAKVIEKCGGSRMENAETDQGTERRYWVPTSPVSV